MEIQDSNMDCKLVHRYLQGDRESGRILYAKSYPYVQKFIAGRLKKSIDDSDVNDAVQETMMRSVQKLHMFRADAKFTTWLCKFANNVILELYRKKGKENKNIDIDSLGSNESHINLYGHNPVEIIIDQERKDCLEGSINQLNPEYREIVILRIYNKVKMKQISALTRESVASLDSRFRRAKKSLKEIIKKNRC